MAKPGLWSRASGRRSPKNWGWNEADQFSIWSWSASLVPQPEQPARTPDRATTEHYDKEQIQPVLGCTCLAPALEHGDQSYEEKYYGEHGDSLHQHSRIPGGNRFSLMLTLWAVQPQ